MDIYILGMSDSEMVTTSNEWDDLQTDISISISSDPEFSNFNNSPLEDNLNFVPYDSVIESEEYVVVIGYRTVALGGGGGGGGHGNSYGEENASIGFPEQIATILKNQLTPQQRANIRANIKKIIPGITDAKIDKIISQASLKSIMAIINIGDVSIVTVNGRSVATMRLSQYYAIYKALNLINTTDSKEAINLLINARNSGAIKIIGK